MTHKQTPPDWILIKAAKRCNYPTDPEQLKAYPTVAAFRALCDMIQKYEQPPVDRDLIKRLEDILTNIGKQPISEDWMYSSIRHCQRNMDFDCEDGTNEPDRQSGTDIAKLINMLPEIIDALRGEQS